MKNWQIFDISNVYPHTGQHLGAVLWKGIRAYTYIFILFYGLLYHLLIFLVRYLMKILCYTQGLDNWRLRDQFRIMKDKNKPGRSTSRMAENLLLHKKGILAKIVKINLLRTSEINQRLATNQRVCIQEKVLNLGWNSELYSIWLVQFTSLQLCGSLVNQQPYN